MKILLALVTIASCVAIAFFYPQYRVEAVLATGLILTLLLILAARNRIQSKGGFGLWFKSVRARLRPAFTSKGKNRKAENLGRINAAIDQVLSQRRRETNQSNQSILGREAKKIGASLSRLRQNYAGYSFVDFHYLDNGACFRVMDDQPYPHEDIYAIYADVGEHRRKIHYCVQKGQMLEDKEVFPAHIPATQFTSLKKAGKVLDKELRTVVGRIAARSQ